MGNMPDWSYRENWDEYLSESGAWDDPDVLIIDVNHDASEDSPIDDWWDLSIDMFNGSISFEWGYVIFDGNLQDYRQDLIPIKLKVPVYTNRQWQKETKDPKPFFAPYLDTYWQLEINRGSYADFMNVLDVINNEHGNGNLFEISEHHAERDSYFKGQPEWERGQKDIMFLRLEGNFLELLAKWLDRELDYSFRGQPEMDI